MCNGQSVRVAAARFSMLMSIPALLGAEIEFSSNAAPQPKPIDISVAQIEALEKPDFKELWPMPQLIADREKDADQLRATSPLQQAARIRNPLLIAHGRLDERVPVEDIRGLSAIYLDILKRFFGV